MPQLNVSQWISHGYAALSSLAFRVQVVFPMLCTEVTILCSTQYFFAMFALQLSLIVDLVIRHITLASILVLKMLLLLAVLSLCLSFICL